MTEEFKKIIDDDIAICEKIKAGECWSYIEDFHKLLKSKYAKIIDGFDQSHAANLEKIIHRLSPVAVSLHHRQHQP